MNRILFMRHIIGIAAMVLVLMSYSSTTLNETNKNVPTLELTKGNGDKYCLLANKKKALVISLEAGDKESAVLKLKIKPTNGWKICDFAIGKKVDEIVFCKRNYRIIFRDVNLWTLGHKIEKSAICLLIGGSTSLRLKILRCKYGVSLEESKYFLYFDLEKGNKICFDDAVKYGPLWDWTDAAPDGLK